MRRFAKDSVIGLLVLAMTTFSLFNCATKKEAAKPSEPAEPTKQVSDPTPKAPESQEAAAPPTTPPPPQEPAAPATIAQPPSPSKAPEMTQVTQPAPQRTTEIILAFVNLRQGPQMDSKITRVLKKGAQLTVLEEKPGWLHVKLEDGTEGWVGKAMTSEGAPRKNP